MPDKYYYVDVNLKTKKILGTGTSRTASNTGNTKDSDVHRTFLTPGQFNKLKAKLDSNS
jgi:hypothetical protein